MQDSGPNEIDFFFFLNCRQQTVTQWVCNLIKTLLLQFRWPFVLAGFTALAMAAISWNLESSENYWIWHRYDEFISLSSLSPSFPHICCFKWFCSVWHVTIYTSSFFFLCSKVDNVNSENQMPVEGSYELTRQDSIPRDDGTEWRGRKFRRFSS